MFLSPLPMTPQLISALERSRTMSWGTNVLRLPNRLRRACFLVTILVATVPRFSLFLRNTSLDQESQANQRHITCPIQYGTECTDSVTEQILHTVPEPTCYCDIQYLVSSTSQRHLLVLHYILVHG
ncbi:uncharacterized protein YALI1_D01497g [Yarrowia lipolytica]|uniref:Uncharacterized protein n=1 Tax=Yarrowia lipolytica TaxID=4952 RepID=A0A1D8NCR6_YARLL|nr:hypothetical protein YALI1_D01497g [Yarrowia lipolytica]